jgi:hypothetical protein
MKTIEWLGASRGLEKHLGSDLHVDGAPEILIEADHVAFVPPFVPMPLPPPVGERGPTYHFVPAPNRVNRPVRTGTGDSVEDPLDIEVARTRGQNFFVLLVLDCPLLLLANPFPYSPNCATWAFMGVEMTQQIAASRDSRRIRQVLRIILALCHASPRDVFGFNGTAGNSLNRLHFVSHRPSHKVRPYAVQQVAAGLGAGLRSSKCLIAPHLSYPIEVARFGYPDPSRSAEEAAAFVERLQSFNADWTFNAAAAVEGGVPVLYVAPRDKTLRPSGWPAQFGFMEILGVGVASNADLVGRVLSGRFTRADWERALSSLRLSSVLELL